MTYAKHYSIALHRNERGAALFVVVMVITLLTAVGIFAARSTSLVDAATGYGRQAAQTLALADYGAKLVASELGEGRAPSVFQLMDLRNQYCPTYGSPAALPLQPCYAFDYSQLELRVLQNTGNAGNAYNVVEYQDALNDGSLGPKFADPSITSGIDGVVIVELFDPFEIANIKGESAGKASGREVTVNSIAQIRPFSALANRAQVNSQWCSNDPASTSASLLSVRSQVLVPTL
jgi:hypothetical protein